MTDLIRKMKDKRLAEGLSVRKLAEKVGITFSGLAKIERGEHDPSEVVRLKIDRWVHGFGAESSEPAWRETVEQRLERLENRKPPRPACECLGICQPGCPAYRYRLDTTPSLPAMVVGGNQPTLAKKTTMAKKAGKGGKKKPKPAPKGY